jgi:protein gp37
VSAIEWTDETWNPVTGCTKVSQGCKNCYAEGVAERFWASQYPPVEYPLPVEEWPPEALESGATACMATRTRRFTDVMTHRDRLEQPLRWRKPRRVFVNSMSDLFHEDVPYDFIESVFGVMARAQAHTFQILTKRPERMREFFAHPGRAAWSHWAPVMDGVPGVRPMRHGEWPGWPLPNVWLGVSVEDQATADERIPLLLDTPAAVRFVSYEPALGPVDFIGGLPSGLHPAFGFLDWIIVGGESGHGARPFDLAWARSVIEQGRAAGVPVFVKQLGAVAVTHSVRQHGSATLFTLKLRDRKGGDPVEWPEDLRVREFPAPVPDLSSVQRAEGSPDA